MEPPTRIVISASRRTDIPAFYMPWFMEQIRRGYFETINPYNRRVSVVSATPDKVHTIVFWSKNFGPLIDGGYDQQLKADGYHLFFNFTINSESPVLEPHVPSLQDRLKQLEYLCRKNDPCSINWRFDPICFYQTSDNKIHNNLKDFNRIAQKAAQCGVQRCITSFMDNYPKIRKRIKGRFSFIDPPMEEKIEIVSKMEQHLNEKRMTLATCCEKDLLAHIPDDSQIQKSSCIPNDLLKEIFGGELCLKRDPGQRIKDGCGCMVSVDIGSYHLHPCYHNCLFCYANPVSGREI